MEQETMKTPIRIIVVADFSGSAERNGIVRVLPRATDKAMDALKPVVELEKGTRYPLETLSDFEVEAIRSRLGASDNDSALITSTLHDNRFQQVEAAWRGLDLLASNLPDDGVVLEILDAPYADLRRRVYDKIMMPDYKGESVFPATVILADYNFGYKGESFEVFRDLAKMAEAIKTPIVAQTGPDFFNLKHLLHLPSIRNPLEQLSARKYDEFHEFRKTDTSFWASLIINRFLLRGPHTSDSYQEPASASKPEQYLFGRGIWLLGANLIRSFSTKGHLVGISGLGTGGEQVDLPIRELPLSRKETNLTPLEAVLPTDIVEGLPYLGLSPLSQVPADMGGQNQPGMIYLHLAANMKHMPDPQGEKIGLLTVHSSLAYSLMLGRVSNLALRYVNDELNGKSEQDISLFKESLLANLYHKEDDELEITSQSDSLAISYRPHLVIHTRRFEIGLEIPT